MWDQAKIQSYIDNQIEENLNLDYKASASLESTEPKKNEIGKDVSAFANSNGGIIIYGLSEDAVNPHLPSAIDPIDRSIFSKETLEQVINSRISPRIHGIQIHPVTIGAPADNHVVYVVDIPQSDTAHQARTKKYYRRYNFQSVEMEDWEIKDIINRKSRTKAEITFRPRFPAGHQAVWMASGGALPMDFDVIATNVGQLVIQHIDFMIAGGHAAAQYLLNEQLVEDKVEGYFSNEIVHKINVNGEEQTINIQRMPILAHTWKKIGEISFSSLFFKSDDKLRLTIATDDNRSSVSLSGKEIYANLIQR